MIRIMFVCYGNICRSPMAEFLLKDLLSKTDRADDFYIASSATSSEELGNPVYYKTAEILDKFNIDYSKKRAVRLTQADYDKYDYFIGMDSENVRNMNRLFNGDKLGKVSRLMSFAGLNQDVSDPWWTRDFEKCYDDIYKGLQGLLNNLLAKNN